MYDQTTYASDSAANFIHRAIMPVAEEAPPDVVKWKVDAALCERLRIKNQVCEPQTHCLLVIKMLANNGVSDSKSMSVSLTSKTMSGLGAFSLPSSAAALAMLAASMQTP